MEGEAASILPSDSDGVRCWDCGSVLDAADNYCRYCGKGQGDHVSWYYRHWGIVLSILGLGPLALFIVWRSPLLSRTAKSLYSAAILALTWYVGSLLYRVWMTMQAMMGQMSIY